MIPEFPCNPPLAGLNSSALAVTERTFGDLDQAPPSSRLEIGRLLWGVRNALVSCAAANTIPDYITAHHAYVLSEVRFVAVGDIDFAKGNFVCVAGGTFFENVALGGTEEDSAPVHSLLFGFHCAAQALARVVEDGGGGSGGGGGDEGAGEGVDEGVHTRSADDWERFLRPEIERLAAKAMQKLKARSCVWRE